MATIEGFTKLIEQDSNKQHQFGQLTKNKTIILVLSISILLIVIVALIGVTVANSGKTDTDNCPFPNIDGGYLVCQDNNNDCFVECYTGYVRSFDYPIHCKSGKWEPQAEIKCLEAVALVIGGASHTDEWNQVEFYSPSGDCNELVADLPDSRSSHTSQRMAIQNTQVMGSSVITCGGHQPNVKTSCIVLQNNGTWDKKWEQHSTMLLPRDDHSSAILQGEMYLIGGTGAEASKSCEIWNAEKEHWYLGPPSHIRDKYGNHDRIDSSCVVGWKDTNLIVTGGYYSTQETWMLHVSSGNWTRLGDMIQGRKDHGCIMIQNKHDHMIGILVAGGNYGGKTTEFLDMTEKTWKWRRMGDMVKERHSFGLVAVGGGKGQVLALGGWGDGSRLSSVEILEKKIWTIANIPLKNAKSSFSVVAVPKTTCYKK